MEKRLYQLYEWRHKRYQPTKRLHITEQEAKEALEKLNSGYTGPRFVLKAIS